MYRKATIIVFYLTILILAVVWQGTVSWAPIVLFGVVPILWLDRWCFRLVPWPGVHTRRIEIARRVGWFLAALAALYVLWPRKNIPWHEGLYLAAEISLATAFLETAVCILAAGRRRWMTGNALPVPGRAGGAGEMVVVCLCLAVLMPLGNLHPPHCMAPGMPTLPGTKMDTVSVPTSDGLQLHGWLMSQKDARALAVFCHGHKGNCGEAGSFLRLLQPLGFNVLACDFRGHGASPGHTTTFGLHETKDVVAAARFLRERYPNKPLFLIGVSYGAAVVLQALPEIPDVRAVWVESGFARFEDTVEQFFHVLPGPVRPYVAGFYDFLGWVDCGFHARDIHPIDRLQGVRVPICFCHGCLDEVVPFAQSQALYESYAGPKAHLWFADGHHHGFRRLHEEEYCARFRQFIEKNLQPFADYTATD